MHNLLSLPKKGCRAKRVILERVDKQFSGGAHKAPYLYRFDAEKRQLFLAKTHF
jgi:hypothetical protein